MFGIIAFGDRQYRVVPGEACIVEKLDLAEGAEVNLNNLVLISDNDEVVLERARLDRYKVKGEVLKQFRENKVISFKKKRRKDYTNKRGHRQYKTLVLIKSIELEG